MSKFRQERSENKREISATHVMSPYVVDAVWLGRRSITMPMFLLAVGALTGTNGLGWINTSLVSEGVKILVEITLTLLLFADSSTLKLRQL